MTARVVSAMLRMTGVQSSFPAEDRRLSIAPLMTSIPEDRQGEGAVRRRCVPGCADGLQRPEAYRWDERQSSYPGTARETSAPAQSLAWGTLRTERTLVTTTRPLQDLDQGLESKIFSLDA